jgi:hypothetical protein
MIVYLEGENAKEEEGEKRSKKEPKRGNEGSYKGDYFT